MVLFYISELVLAMNYLHNKNIIYRDIKPENVMLDLDGHVKLVDFGLSKQLSNKDELTESFCGTIEYVPPEMVLNLGCNYLADIYSLGILTYELLVGFAPFCGSNRSVIQQNIMSKTPLFPPWISELAKDFILKCTIKSPRKRLGSKSDILEVFNHPWLAGLSKNKVNNKQVSPPIVPNFMAINCESNSEDVENIYKKMLQEQQCVLEKKYQLEGFEYDYKKADDRVHCHESHYHCFKTTEAKMNLNGNCNDISTRSPRSNKNKTD